MHTPTNSFEDLSTLVAGAADLCLQPWKHSVVDLSMLINGDSLNKNSGDIILRIECRSSEGDRHPEYDLEIEIFRSGNELNLMLGRLDKSNRPILWHGHHPVWMDGDTGNTCNMPLDGAPLEALARKIRSLVSHSD